MEIGAVMGAAPRRAVQRLTSDPGDVIILLGGRTGRDGIGGATGAAERLDFRGMVVCLVFKIHQPFFGLPVHFHRNHNGTCIDFIGLFLIL